MSGGTRPTSIDQRRGGKKRPPVDTTTQRTEHGTRDATKRVSAIRLAELSDDLDGDSHTKWEAISYIGTMNSPEDAEFFVAARAGWPAALDALEAAWKERDEARATARVLAHSYQHNEAPPRWIVAAALGYPARPAPDGEETL